ncbi:aminotransferase class IV [soil metagenome]
MSYLWLNDSLVTADEARISTADRGFTLGDGIFETMRVTNGTVFRLPDHLHRLRRSATLIGMQCPELLEHAIAETLSANELAEGALRLTLTRGESPRGLRIPASRRPTLVIGVHTHTRDERQGQDGVSALIATGRLNEHAASTGIKQLGYLDAVLAQREASAAGMEEALLLDTAGHLAEAAASNLFLVRNGELLTPPLECGVLPGITRATVLEIASRLGLPIRSEPLLPADLKQAEEAFLTNSLRGLTPLVRVDGVEVGTGSRGPITVRLQDAYQRLVTSETRRQNPPAA